MEAAGAQHRSCRRLAHATHLATVEGALPAAGEANLRHAHLSAADTLLQACAGSLECQAAVGRFAQSLNAALAASTRLGTVGAAA